MTQCHNKTHWTIWEILSVFQASLKDLNSLILNISKILLSIKRDWKFTFKPLCPTLQLSKCCWHVSWNGAVVGGRGGSYSGVNLGVSKFRGWCSPHPHAAASTTRMLATLQEGEVRYRARVVRSWNFKPSSISIKIAPLIVKIIGFCQVIFLLFMTKQLQGFSHYDEQRLL